jgi:hypothetical protein
MTRIAITGHRGLPDDTVGKVRDAISDQLGRDDDGDVTGLSCLADGADQIFARAVLDAGGRLEVIVPAAAYRDGLPEHDRREYDALLAAASDVRRLDFTESTSEAHMAASQAMLGAADRLYAVWDGSPHAVTAARPTSSPTQKPAASPSLSSGRPAPLGIRAHHPK